MIKLVLVSLSKVRIGGLNTKSTAQTKYTSERFDEVILVSFEKNQLLNE